MFSSVMSNLLDDATIDSLSESHAIVRLSVDLILLA